MKAAVLHQLGQLPVCEDFSDPVAGEGEVIVEMRAAGIHPIVKALAAGTHYGSTGDVPFIVGIDGTGVLADGTRVYCGGARKPYGTMAERTVVPKGMCLPLPEGLTHEMAAALANPGMSAWLSLTWRAQLAAGETVLILGATGVAGHLAVQMAKLLGARRVIAAGRNAAQLESLRALGANAVIQLDQPQEDLVAAFASEVKAGGIDVVIDYLWGAPTEAFIRAISQRGLDHKAGRVRLVEVGQSAGATITLPADVLRSSGLEINGSGFGSASIEQIVKAIPEFFALAAQGKLHIELETLPLAQIEQAWTRKGDGKRVVVTL
ncbi:quinone oxidoreductase family protein [Paracidobacterium acidisoli]|uniref:Zinc-binding alcohol dehydrogenase family protein n=1 Tax=Paracidobacterium acidisoli TaxID=2303751 RepID=A0A372IUS4_9BACT|nr:zinc-binding alcohol dehydrogenase family protein [Paracidobacterium acidisoli]MBT9329594.1 zinc-binding alcohol dehydrogenase family protein [Paracidobacterium acidisoli]